MIRRMYSLLAPQPSQRVKEQTQGFKTLRVHYDDEHRF